MVAAATQTLKVLQPAEPHFSIRGAACCFVSQATIDALGELLTMGDRLLGLQKGPVWEGEWDWAYILGLDSLGVSL